jgi:hypothetical protein
MQSLRIATLFVTVLCVLGPTPARAQAKVAIVDMQRALTETEDGKTAKAQLEKLKDAKQKDIDAQQTELRKLKEQRLLLPALLHSCDIGNPARRWHISTAWADRITEEFFLQGELRQG